MLFRGKMDMNSDYDLQANASPAFVEQLIP